MRPSKTSDSSLKREMETALQKYLLDLFGFKKMETERPDDVEYLFEKAELV